MKKILGLLIAAILLTACSHRNLRHLKHPTKPEDVAISGYEALANGDYDSYISMTCSCDSFSDAYKHKQIMLLKQYMGTINKNYGGIVKIEASEAKTKKDKNAAEVYIILHFKNKQREELLVSLICEKNQWKLR